MIVKPITLRSLSNDPAQTIIKGSWDPVGTNGSAAVRCIYAAANNASLIGFTITNGATLAKSGLKAEIDNRGGGIYAIAGTMAVSNCVIVGNSAVQGGGAYGWALSLYDCVIAGNSALTGETTFSRGAGGGACGCALLSNCLLTENLGSFGAASSIAEINNCVIISNNSANAVYDSKLYNCLVVRNTCTDYAARSDNKELYNCTVAHNTRGVRQSSLFNCIVYYNGKSNNDRSTLAYSCIPDAVSGEGNITNEPSFVNSAVNDYRLNRDSPCINAGTNGVWTTGGSDLDGQQRIDKVSSLVDMGCYEYVIPYRGTILNIR